jgi:hypothetical protein
MEVQLLAQASPCTGWCGWGVLIASLVLFPGTVWLLTGAVFGNRMGYLISATSFFAFMIILSALWTFGAPGTPRYLGPKGALPAWVVVTAGERLASPALPIVEQYPDGPWKPAEEAGLKVELEPATLAFQAFLAEEATAELEEESIEGEVASSEFQIEQLRFARVEDQPVAMAQSFALGGGPEVLVFGYKDPGNEPLPSYVSLAVSVIGFAVHLPFLDRAERRRKEILTGGGQPPFRGPA